MNNEREDDECQEEPQIQLEDLPIALRDLFSPYKRVKIALELGGTTVINKPFRQLTFGGSLDSYSGTEAILHEVAHAIECPEERFGMEDSGLNAKRTRPGRASWAVEREIVVLAIQRRLHDYVGETFHLSHSAFGLNHIRSFGDWLENITGQELCWSEKRSNSDIAKKAISDAVKFIEDALPSTEKLIETWHERCQKIDNTPGRILSERAIEKRLVEPHDPLTEDVRLKMYKHLQIAR